MIRRFALREKALAMKQLLGVVVEAVFCGRNTEDEAVIQHSKDVCRERSRHGGSTLTLKTKKGLRRAGRRSVASDDGGVRRNAWKAFLLSR